MLNGARQTTENWVLVPVSDPGKLGLMRCAYRQAIAPCIGIDLTFTGCPDCRKLRKDFHGPSDSASKEPDQNENLPCLNSACWFQWSCKKHLPKSADSHFVGRYGGVFVWIPRQGRDMLTRLTLTILDYAVNDAVQFGKRTKTVELYVDDTGEIVSEGQLTQLFRTGVRKITATIPIDLPSGSVVVLDKYGEFLHRFGTEMKRQLLARAVELGVSKDDLDDSSFWQAWPVGKFVKGMKAVKSPGEPAKWVQVYRRDGKTPVAVREDLRDPLWWIQKNNVIPRDIPDDDDLLRGPATFERKGSASAGLQALEQRLTTASGASPK